MTELETRLYASDAEQEKKEIKQQLDRAHVDIKCQIDAGCRPEEYGQLMKELAAIDAASDVLNKIEST